MRRITLRFAIVSIIASLFLTSCTSDCVTYCGGVRVENTGRAIAYSGFR